MSSDHFEVWLGIAVAAATYAVWWHSVEEDDRRRARRHILLGLGAVGAALIGSVVSSRHPLREAVILLVMFLLATVLMCCLYAKVSFHGSYGSQPTPQARRRAYLALVAAATALVLVAILILR